MNRRHRVLLIVAIVLPAVAAAVLTAGPVRAAPSLTVSPQAGAPGEQLTATGAGFQPGAIGLHLETVAVGGELATGVVAADGEFVLSVAIPDVPDGPYQLIACLDISPAAECREQTAAAIRVVTAPPPTTSTTEPLDFVAATTSSPTTTTSPGFVAETTTPPIPTIPPVIVSSTTSEPLDEAQPPGETIPDTEVRAVEITQGIQDLASRMPLVAGRATTVRVHIDTSGGYVGTVDGALLVERAGEEDLVLTPDNGPIPPGLDRTEIDGALNFDLPWQVVTEGETTFTAQVWSAGGAWITEEPDSANNLKSRTVQFLTGENPTVWLVALDDGAGPGPVVEDVDDVLFPFAVFAYEDLVEYLPLASVNFQIYPEPVFPGPEAAEPGLWNLGLDSDVDPTAAARRHEPNIRMSTIAEVSGLLDDATMVGLVDPSIPTGGFSGWASNGVSWTQAEGGTAAHEVAHVLGLDHVNCVGDTDGDGVSQEDEAGAIDWSHPNGLPPVCSLSEVDPAGFFGYTTYRDPATIYSNDPGHPQAAFPLMSYADPKWSDPYHYCRLLDATGVPCNPALLGLPPADPFQLVDCEPEELPGQLQLDLCVSQEPAADADDAAPAPGQLVAELTTNSVGMETLQIAHEGLLFDVPLDPESWIVASGSVDVASGTGTLGQSLMRDELSPMTASRLAISLDGYEIASARAGLALQLTAADGSALAVVPVADDGAGHGDGSDHSASFGFFSPVPWVDGAVSLDLLVDGSVVDSQPISPTAPTVGAVEVETIGSARTHTVHWDVADPDPGALEAMTFTVLWSADGETWIPAAVDVTGTEVTIPDSAGLPGGDAVQVQVIANDGVRTGAATSEAFSAPDQAPRVAITPMVTEVAINGQPLTYEVGDVVELQAVVSDPEAQGGHRQEIEVLSYSWGSSQTGLGTGPVLTVGDLPVGEHTITVDVTDRAGNVSTADVVVEITERTTPARATEPAEPAAVVYFNTFQCIPDSAAQVVGESCAAADD